MYSKNNKVIHKMEFVPKKVVIGSPVFAGNYYDKKFESINEAEQIRRSIKQGKLRNKDISTSAM